MSSNPYAAPKAVLADAQGPAIEGDFLANGQRVSTSNGWTWITEAWRLFRMQPGIWIGGLLVILVILVAAMFMPFIGTPLMAALYPIFGGGLMLGSHALWKGESMRFSHIFGGFQKNVSSLVVLSGVFVVFTILINMLVATIAGLDPMHFLTPTTEMPANLDWVRYMLGTLVGLALWVPIYMALWFAPALVVLNDYKAGDAMKSSFAACLKNILPFLLYGLLFLIVFFISALPLGLGLLVTMPLSVISIYTAYRDIFYSN
jgi:uncharacterized membrane protein